jgi:RNA polymerase sigma factor (sigma-70 family)
MSVHLNDHELVQQYLAGHEDSLATLLERHKRKVFSSVLMVVREKQLAEDIFQDTFFKVILTLKRGQYNEEGKFLPWVLRIARNLIIDHFRRVKKLPPVPVYVNEEGEEISVFNQIAADDDTAASAERSKFRKEMRDLVNRLPSDQREVVLMRMYYDMSFKEISEFTNVSINTALGRMRYALLNLRKMIGTEKPELVNGGY